MKRTVSSSAEVRRALDRIRALRGDEARLREFALEVLPGEGNPELLSAALRALGPGVRVEDHGLLVELYEHFDSDGKRRDPGGSVRIEVLNVLWHLRHADDRELAAHAASTVEATLQGDGQMIRAAGLALLGVLDRAAANFRAVEMLGTGDGDRMTAEPALTAARLLSANGETVPLALYAFAFRRSGQAEVVAECLRALAGVPAGQIASLLEDFGRSDDDVLLLGLADFIVGHEPDPLVAAAAKAVFKSAGHDEVYGYLVASVVASRREDLMAEFLETLKTETSPGKRKIAREALELAAPSPAVNEARAGLGART